jgi:hypothetical protein
MGWDRDLHQVKPKFGGLRFYIGSASDEFRDRIEKAEEQSKKICEQCGKPGALIDDAGWLTTLCDGCAR